MQAQVAEHHQEQESSAVVWLGTHPSGAGWCRATDLGGTTSRAGHVDGLGAAIRAGLRVVLYGLPFAQRPKALG